MKSRNYVGQIRSQGKIEDLTLEEVEDLTLEGIGDLTLREIGSLTLLQLLQLLAIHVHEEKESYRVSSDALLSGLSVPSQIQNRTLRDSGSKTPVTLAHAERVPHVDLPSEQLSWNIPHSWNIPTAPLNEADASAVKTMRLPPTARGKKQATMMSGVLRNAHEDAPKPTVVTGSVLPTKRAHHLKKTLKTSVIVALNIFLVMVILISTSFLEAIFLSGNPTYQIVVFVLLVIILSNILGGTVKHYSQVGVNKLMTTMHLRAIKKATTHRDDLQADTTTYLRALRDTWERER